MYIIGKINPLTQEDILTIEKGINFLLPQDYKSFLLKYGYGDIHDYLYFNIPAENFMANNFKEHMNLWEWADGFDVNTVLDGIAIANTKDGDIVLCINNDENQYMLLPRNSEYPMSSTGCAAN